MPRVAGGRVETRGAQHEPTQDSTRLAPHPLASLPACPPARRNAAGNPVCWREERNSACERRTRKAAASCASFRGRTQPSERPVARCRAATRAARLLPFCKTPFTRPPSRTERPCTARAPPWRGRGTEPGPIRRLAVAELAPAPAPPTSSNRRRAHLVDALECHGGE